MEVRENVVGEGGGGGGVGQRGEKVYLLFLLGIKTHGV